MGIDGKGELCPRSLGASGWANPGRMVLLRCWPCSSSSPRSILNTGGEAAGEGQFLGEAKWLWPQGHLMQRGTPVGVKVTIPTLLFIPLQNYQPEHNRLFFPQRACEEKYIYWHGCPLELIKDQDDFWHTSCSTLFIPDIPYRPEALSARCT